MSEASSSSALNNLFGNFKAEWLRERVFDLFTTPSYFPQLEDARPCLLLGARGTGKTTVLRSLSYEGQFALSNRDPKKISQWPYYGFYYRVDTNRVTAFKGPELTDTLWTRLFGHYINLLLCGQVLKFLAWYHELLPDAPRLSADACQTVAASLLLNDDVANERSLLAGLNFARVRFESFINNITPDKRPDISIQGGPVDELLSAVASLPQFSGKHFFFLIDEYENLLDDQQVVLNTLLKHASGNYTFKIGVKELGWRKRTTLNSNEQLISPADYVRVHIGDKLSGRFGDFAHQILTQRLAQLPPQANPPPSVQEILPSLSDEEEAILLGVKTRNESSYLRVKDPKLLAIIKTLTPLQQYFVFHWARDNQEDIRGSLNEIREDPNRWNVRFENYRHALLFTIRSGKSGIRKYYCGWDTFVRLSGDNIRYLLELVDQALILHLDGNNDIASPIDASVQTMAAQNIGRKNVLELEGLSVHGANLTRMVLGLGRVFQVMASELHGHAPEVNQFHLADSGPLPADASELLRAAIMHLALVRTTANKLADEGDLKDYDYSLHPVFTPFFVFSHRRKRKMAMAPQRLVGLVQHPTPTIRSILRQTNRDVDSEVPEQLQLFESYYGRPD